MLLTVSETLTNAWDWIVVHCAELGITISIPILVGIIGKILLSVVKNKITIKTSVLNVVNTTKQQIGELKELIKDFRVQTEEQLNKFEQKVDEKIDHKFEDLRQKRIELYNNIMNGVDKIEEKSTEIIEQAETEISNIEEVIEKVDIQVDETIISVQEEISADDIMR